MWYFLPAADAKADAKRLPSSLNAMDCPRLMMKASVSFAPMHPGSLQTSSCLVHTSDAPQIVEQNCEQLDGLRPTRGQRRNQSHQQDSPWKESHTFMVVVIARNLKSMFLLFFLWCRSRHPALWHRSSCPRPWSLSRRSKPLLITPSDGSLPLLLPNPNTKFVT